MRIFNKVFSNKSQNNHAPSNISKGAEKYLYPNLPNNLRTFAFWAMVFEVVFLIISGIHDIVFLANSLEKIGIGSGATGFISPIVMASLLISILVFTMLHAGGKKAERNEGAKRLWFGWFLAVAAIVVVRIFALIGENICTTPASELNPTPCEGKPTTWAEALMSPDGISGLSEIILLTTFTFLTALLAYSLGKRFLNVNLNSYRYLDKKLDEDMDAINQDIKGLETIGEKPKRILDEYIYHRNETKDDMKKYRDDVLQLILDEYISRHKSDSNLEVIMSKVDEIKEDVVNELNSNEDSDSDTPSGFVHNSQNGGGGDFSAGTGGNVPFPGLGGGGLAGASGAPSFGAGAPHKKKKKKKKKQFRNKNALPIANSVEQGYEYPEYTSGFQPQPNVNQAAMMYPPQIKGYPSQQTPPQPSVPLAPDEEIVRRKKDTKQDIDVLATGNTQDMSKIAEVVRNAKNSDENGV